MANRVVSVRLQADVGQYQSAMTKAAATTRTVGDDAVSSSRRAQSGFDLAGKGALLMGGAAAGAALGLKSVLTAASDLNETMNKSAVIFGKNSGQIEHWADDAARSFGLSKAAAMEAAAGFGNMFQQLGFTGDEAVGASQDVVKLAADLGSFNNLGTEDVLQRIAAGFRGEYDSLQMLIPNINAARVEQEALATTGKESAKQLTAQEKAAAVLAIVQRDGAAAANDFAETSTGLANSTKIAAAEFDDLQAKIGQAFLPVATEAMQFLSGTAIPVLGGLFDVVAGAASAFGDLPEPVQAAVVALTAVALLKNPVSSAFETIALKSMYAKDAIAGASLSMGGMRSAGAGLLGVFGGPWGLAIAGATVGVSLLASWLGKGDEATKEAAAATRDYAGALEQANGVITQSVRQAAAKAAQDAGLLDVADDLGISLSSVTDAITTQGGALDSVREKLQAYAYDQTTVITDANGQVTSSLSEQGQAALAALAALDSLAGQTTSTKGGQEQLAQATEVSSGSMMTFAQQIDAAKAEMDQAKQAVDNFKLSLDILTGAHVSMIQVESAFEAAVASADGAVKDMTGSVLNATGGLNLQSESGRAAADVLLGVRDSGNQLISTMLQQNATTDQVMTKEAQLRESFIVSATQMGINRQAAEVLADQILGIPDSRNTVITADTAPATRAVDDLVNKISRAGGYTMVVSGGGVQGGRSSVPNAAGNIIEAYADGGLRSMKGGLAQIVAPNTWRVIGDRVRDDEAYIPINGDPRSRNLLAETADRMGYQLVAAETRHLAAGGILAGQYTIPVGVTDAKLKDLEKKLTGPTSPGMAGALAWARSQVGKPYLWGGVGPAGYDCSGFMSAITNVIRGKNPHSRIGATATFPWPGFRAGSGPFTIGSTKNAGGGIGHMAGTLNGVNVESRGGQGVVVGGSARGANDRLFTTRAAVYDQGGLLGSGMAALNLSGSTERVLDPNETRAYEAGLRSREFSGGGGRATAAPVVVSLEGATVTGRFEFGSDGMVTLVDGRIESRFEDLYRQSVRK